MVKLYTDNNSNISNNLKSNKQIPQKRYNLGSNLDLLYKSLPIAIRLEWDSKEREQSNNRII